MDYARYFEGASVLGLARRKDPYSFVETYQLMQRVFGYSLHYVNFGYWPEGITTPEPAREMTLHMGRALGLKAGDRLLEAGSGLGQAAVDMANAFSLDKVEGLNINTAQLGFANELAGRSGLADRVSHRQADACAAPEQMEQGAFHHAFAQECIGHFPEPERFLAGLRKMLPPGGRFAFTLVVCPEPPPRVFAEAANLVFHVVPKDGAHWERLLKGAGFQIAAREDMRETVFRPLLSFVNKRLKEDDQAMAFASAPVRAVMNQLLGAALGGLDKGYLGYEMLVGEVPA